MFNMLYICFMHVDHIENWWIFVKYVIIIIIIIIIILINPFIIIIKFNIIEVLYQANLQ